MATTRNKKSIEQKDLDEVVAKIKGISTSYAQQETKQFLGGLFTRKGKHSKDINALGTIIDKIIEASKADLMSIQASALAANLSIDRTTQKINEQNQKTYDDIKSAIQLAFNTGVAKKGKGDEEAFIKYLNEHSNDSHYYRQLGLLLSTLYSAADKEAHPALAQLQDPYPKKTVDETVDENVAVSRHATIERNPFPSLNAASNNEDKTKEPSVSEAEDTEAEEDDSGGIKRPERLPKGVRTGHGW